MSQGNGITTQNLPTLRELKRIPEFEPLKPKQIRFISALVASDLRVEEAAKRCGINWRQHYRWKKNQQYEQALEVAKQMLADKLEAVMLNHAVEGREAPVIYQGRVTDYVREVNAHERIALLKGLKPQYRDNFNVANVQGPISVNFTFAPSSEKDVTPKRDLDMTNEDK